MDKGKQPERPPPSIDVLGQGAVDNYHTIVAQYAESAVNNPSAGCFIFSLPAELLDAILECLPPADLARACLVCRALTARAASDYIWHKLVQAHVPGSRVTSPYPCSTFRELWAGHDPRWFLPKHKIWFSGHDLMGKLILVRYDQRRGIIEGYQLVAGSTRRGTQPWQAAEHVTIHDFEPTVGLHLDKPVLELRCEPPQPKAAAESTIDDGESSKENQWQEVSGGIGGINPVSILHLGGENSNSSSGAGTASGSASGSSGRGNDYEERYKPLNWPPPPPSRYAQETPMMRNRDNGPMLSNFVLSKEMPAEEAEECAQLGFPYGDSWPPPSIPSPHRFKSIHSGRRDFNPFLRRDPASHGAQRPASHLNVTKRLFTEAPLFSDLSLDTTFTPRTRAEISELSFRTRRWMEMRSNIFWAVGDRSQVPLGTHVPPSTIIEGAGAIVDGAADPANALSVAMDADATNFPVPALSAPLRVVPLEHRRHVGEEITTWSTLDPALYTPTPDQPWKGIWVGDYSGHGCEFLLINQEPHDGEDVVFDDSTMKQVEEETDERFEERKRDARIYRGRLEAIKLTGDPNVPRGEYTFIVDDLGPDADGFVSLVQDEPFRGVRVVKSRGHVAETGFINDRYIESQLLMISPDRLAQYWLGFGHISFFERVDIDKLLNPS